VDIHPVRSNTIADSISVDLPRDGVAGVRAVIESGGEAVTVDDPQILEAIPELAQRSGVFAEPSAAAVYAGLKKMVSEGRVQRDERVVCMVTGNGLKDTPRALEAAPPPVVIDPTVEAARKAVSTLV
jgi:threonine synthase